MMRFNLENPEPLLQYLHARSVELPNGCLLWQGARTVKGYGQIMVQGAYWRLNRLAYRLYHGPYDLSLQVLHTCDTPNCWAESHLYLGTPLDNSRDMFSRGRQKPARGEQHFKAVLTEEQVREIRRLHTPSKGPYTATALAQRYGVSVNSISLVLRRRSWAHVSD